METFSFIINVLMAFLLVRYSLDFNPDLSAKIEKLDTRFLSLITKMKNGEARSALDIGGGFFGIIGLIHFVLFIFSTLAALDNKVWLLYISTTFIYSVFVWLSIKWFTSYEKFSLKFIKDNGLLALYSVFIPVMDYLSPGSNLTGLLVNQMLIPVNILGLDISATGVLWKDGLLIAAIFECIIFTTWILTSLMFIPVAASGLIIVFITINVANILAKLSPKRPLSPFCFVIWLVTAPYGWF